MDSMSSSSSRARESARSSESVGLAEVERRIEEFIRTELGVTDPGLTRDTELFERYLDSVGVIELLLFVEREYAVHIPEEDLLSVDFSRIDGIASIVHRLSQDEAGANA
jgi:acyl carrier protein